MASKTKRSKSKTAARPRRAKIATRKAPAKRKPAVRRKSSAKAAKRKAAAKRRPATPNAQAKLEQNKRTVLALYEALIGRKDFEAARQYMGPHYKQHAPYAADGHDGVREWVKGFKAAFPNHRYELKRVIAEGDFVMLHLHGMNGPNPFGESVIDYFRLENGKVVEHWDVIQPIPDKVENANSMF